MSPRDLIVVAAVVLVAGVAAADALRGIYEGGTTATMEEGVSPSPRREAPPAKDAPAGYPRGAARGRLVFTDARDCRVRMLTLGDGSEALLPRFAGDCRLWAPPVGSVIAYGLGPAREESELFKLVDVARPEEELGAYRALFGYIAWSLDGTRAAWCGRSREGFDLAIGGGARRLDDCPTAYTPEGAVAFAVGNALLAESQTIVRAPGGITHASWGRNGSLAIVVDGRRIQVYRRGLLRIDVSLPPAVHGKTPVFSPDNCAVLFKGAGDRRPHVELIGFRCFYGPSQQRWEGHDAAWSPDGRWVAIAEREAIALHRVLGEPMTVRWPAQAAELAWQG